MDRLEDQEDNESIQSPESQLTAEGNMRISVHLCGSELRQELCVTWGCTWSLHTVK